MTSFYFTEVRFQKLGGPCRMTEPGIYSFMYLLHLPKNLSLKPFVARPS
jgi:hypothetical protein